MKKLLHLSYIVFLLSSCANHNEKKTESETSSVSATKFYSKSVKDTFFISVSLPENKNAQKNNIYPVVYVLDANLYFDIMATTFHHYAEVGLLPEMILVGIGYKNFQIMDSLRNRDYTFPVAIPEYEMSTSGGGVKFLSFINTELIPDIDSKYPVDKAQRILMGHSLGGYFTTYALQQNLVNKNNLFSTYIAASPSTNYDHDFIIGEFEKLAIDTTHKPKVYMTFGGLEDENEEDSTVMKSNVVISNFTRIFQKNKLKFKGDLYSNLDHMNTGFPTFTKGLQWSLGGE